VERQNHTALPIASDFFNSLLGGPEPKVSESAIAVMSSGQFIDGEKARQQLGFYPEVSIDEAIVRALKWFQGNGLVKSAIKS
jgi:nucleoside-diphosphate-sugar epimerase